jgi:L-ribulose-5-phosphate 3-epimerase
MATNKIGTMTSLTVDGNPFETVSAFGLESCQLVSWNPRTWLAADPQALRKKADAAGIDVAACWVGYPGPVVWDFIQGPLTLGLVPAEYRAMRLEALKIGADFAAAFGAPAIITHCGFIPEACASAEYRGTLAAIYDIASYCADRKIGFWFETGQETPVTLLRVIEDLRIPGLGINLDPANLILYGMGSPVDALDVFGKHVRCLHAKDGVYPTNGRSLGHETKVGDGKVNFPVMCKKLAELGYNGAYIIEREISGEQQKKDIGVTVDYLRKLIGSL